MLRLSWSKSSIEYLKANEGKVNALELAFADYRLSQNGFPTEGTAVEVSDNIYIWKIHGHFVRLRHMPGGEKLHMRIEVIRPETATSLNAN